jgi:hypothetical protein
MSVNAEEYASPSQLLVHEIGTVVIPWFDGILLMVTNSN